MLRVAIIIGSTRPGRKADSVAKETYEIARKRSDAEFVIGVGLEPGDVILQIAAEAPCVSVCI